MMFRLYSSPSPAPLIPLNFSNFYSNEHISMLFTSFLWMLDAGMYFLISFYYLMYPFICWYSLQDYLKFNGTENISWTMHYCQSCNSTKVLIIRNRNPVVVPGGSVGTDSKTGPRPAQERTVSSKDILENPWFHQWNFCSGKHHKMQVR